MIVAEPRTQALNGATQAGPDLERAIRAYVRTYAVLHGRPKAADDLGVSRHTLWRFLRRGHTGRAIPRAVVERVGGSAQALEDAKERLILQARAKRRQRAVPVAESAALSQSLEDALLLACAAPLATVDELSRFGRVPASTLRDRLVKLAKRGLVDSVPDHLGNLGPHPKRRYFPTEQGIVAGGRIEHGTEYFLSVALHAPVLSTVKSGGPKRIEGGVPSSRCGWAACEPKFAVQDTLAPVAPPLPAP